MDPVTAIFNFLSTQAGQQILLEAITLDKSIIADISAMIKKTNAKTS